MRSGNRVYIYWIAMGLFGITAISGWTQTTPTPAPVVNFSQGCLDDTADPGTNLISNGDFTEGVLTDGSPPEFGWYPGSPSAILQKETLSDEVENFYLQFPESGSSISTVAGSNSTSTQYKLKFCVVIPAGGQIIISAGGQIIAGVPSVAGGSYTGSFVQDGIRLGTSQSERTIEITYVNDSDDPAYIDNVQLVPSISSGSDDPTPTPTVEVPTPTPQPTGPPPSPTPTAVPGIPTPTPTPAIASNSVQLAANPPMLVVSPDDFSGSNFGVRKQIALDLKVVGANGDPINIQSIDEDATIRFFVDTRGEAEGVGVVQGFESTDTNWRSINNKQINLKDDFYGDMGGRAYFFPLKPYTGTVRVIVEIKYKGWANGREEERELRGVVPIILQVDKAASLTDATGDYNAVQSFNLGRKPGDRGFRPDMRTNLYFRERIR